MPIPIHLVDAFSDRAFAGNPAGVCILDSASRGDDDWMQRAPDALDEPALDALGLSPADVGGVHRSKFDVLVLVNDPEVLRSIRPDFRRVAKIQTRGVIVTSRSDEPQYSFLSRFFAPQT